MNLSRKFQRLLQKRWQFVVQGFCVLVCPLEQKLLIDSIRIPLCDLFPESLVLHLSGSTEVHPFLDVVVHNSYIWHNVHLVLFLCFAQSSYNYEDNQIFNVLVLLAPNYPYQVKM